MTANAKRAAFRSNGWQLSSGRIYHDVSLLNISHPRFRESIDLCARKLLLSLYYRHIGHPVPRTGSAVMQWAANTLHAQGQLDGLLAKMPHLGQPVHHHTTSLAEQFTYRSYADESKGLGVFLVTLHSALAILGVLSKEPDVACQAGAAWQAFTVLPGAELLVDAQ